MKKSIAAIFVLLILINFNFVLGAQNIAEFDNILSPLNKFYDLVKYSSTAIASLFLVFSGISYMIAGNDPKKKSSIKTSIAYILIGLGLIWAAPYIVSLISK